MRSERIELRTQTTLRNVLQPKEYITPVYVVKPIADPDTHPHICEPRYECGERWEDRCKTQEALVI